MMKNNKRGIKLSTICYALFFFLRLLFLYRLYYSTLLFWSQAGNRILEAIGEGRFCSIAKAYSEGAPVLWFLKLNGLNLGNFG